ncbi:MAG TPA: hypothetical protein IAA64_08975 [Candidatus Ornithocaccomicrobium faecavium]|uniref:Peptidase C-terminal archaeal/bacterial domain-containing protein n=1 Tax=Candidatus Ornithocaccomicrobium faecavium TaxID=2840890 RepID=A0A9D1TD03_9FIRM|nr:hypothetical protein [Candidatus Ornithocaccomicrobium faecavium]
MRKFVLLLVLLLALPAAAMADDSQFIEHEPFALDDSWVEGSTRPGEYHYYPFIVEEVGLVTVRVQMFCGGHVELLDADLIEWDEGYFNGTIGAPETQDFVYYLEPGVYCLRNGSDNSQGDFRIKGIFEPCPSTETAESDDYLGAQALPSGETLSGVLTEWDGHDFYTFTLDAEEQVYLTANTTLESLMPNLTLYDGDMVKMSEEYGFKGYAEEFLLPAGTYYIDVWGNKGPYTLKAVYEEDLPATVPAEEATEEEVDVQNESDSFDTAPEEGFTDPDSFTEELGSLLFDLLDSF